MSKPRPRDFKEPTIGPKTASTAPLSPAPKVGRVPCLPGQVMEGIVIEQDLRGISIIVEPKKDHCAWLIL